MSSSSDHIEWEDDRYWYELADGELRVYATDVSERNREQRDLFTTHVSVSLSDVERAVGYPDRNRIDLEWDVATPWRLLWTVLRTPTPPETIEFEDDRTYRRVADAIRSATVE